MIQDYSNPLYVCKYGHVGQVIEERLIEAEEYKKNKIIFTVVSILFFTLASIGAWNTYQNYKAKKELDARIEEMRKKAFEDTMNYLFTPKERKRDYNIDKSTRQI